MIRYGFMISVGLGLASVVSCGGGDDPGKGGGDGDTGTGDGDGDGDISLGDGDTGVGDGDTGDGDGGIDGCMPFEAEGCSGITYEGENVPLSIYVMYDLSCSMSCTTEQSGCCLGSDEEAPESEWRITPVRAAMTSFLQDPASAGIYVGLGFFGDHNVNDNEEPSVCNVEAHTDTEADIAQLPGAADNLVQIVQNGQPQGGTPTHLAIEGACTYTNSYKAANPAHKVVILLVTDGIPEHSCDADIEQAVDAATDCYDGGAGRETYVLGVVAGNNSLDQLNAIAEAGGTEMAYLTDSNDIEGSVLAALNAIRADAIIPCTLNVPQPETGTIDYGQVNVGICDAAEETVHTYYVEDPADCDNGAWYYEQVGDEQVVQLCDQTCDTVSAAGASLTMTVGCETVVVPVR